MESPRKRISIARRAVVCWPGKPHHKGHRLAQRKALGSYEPGWREGFEIVFRLRAFDDIRHYFRCDRGEQDSVAEVAGCDVITRNSGCAEDRKSVGSTRAKARPVFEDAGIAELRDEFERGAMQALDGCKIGALVEACFFDGGADQKSTVSSRDEICLGRSDHMFYQLARGHHEAEHLSFDWPGGEEGRRNLAGPCTRAVGDFVRKK